MTSVMGAGRVLGLMSTPPPERVVESAGRAVGAPPSRKERGALAWVAHFAFGAALGALFRAFRPSPRRPLAEGLLFGAGVWAANYLVALPAANLFPSAARDDPSRQSVMVAAHLVFGATLASLPRPD
jgi:hypothetical protein